MKTCDRLNRKVSGLYGCTRGNIQRIYVIGNQHFFCVHFVYFVYTWCWWGDLRERDYLENPDVDGRIILRWVFRKLDVGAGLIWLRIGTCGELL